MFSLLFIHACYDLISSRYWKMDVRSFFSFLSPVNLDFEYQLKTKPADGFVIIILIFAITLKKKEALFLLSLASLA